MLQSAHNLFRSPIALLKMYATRSAQETARDAVQIFGGRGVTKTGMGRVIEHVRLKLVSSQAKRMFTDFDVLSTTER